MKDIKMSLGEWSENLFRRVKAMFTGLDDRVTALEEGGGGEVNVIESISMNGTNVPPDANKNVALAESDPTVPAWAKAATKPTYTAAEVGALPDPATLNQVDITQPDNGLTAAGIGGVSRGFDVRDKNARNIGWVGFVALSNGDTQGRLWVYNYINNALYVSLITMTYHKDGTVTYTITHPASFRSAIEAQQEVGLYVDAQGYLCQMIRSDT